MTALGMWAVVRFAAAFTWRDARVLGPFGADQLILVLVAAVAFVGQPAPGAVRRMRAAWVALRTARREARASKAALAAAAAQATAAEQAAAAAQAAVTTDATKAERTSGAATEGSAAGTLSAPIGESEAAPDHTA
jgi:Sec-independent protein translocase protein TatA